MGRTWQEASGWSSCSEVERMTTSPVVTTKDLHCMAAACRLLRLPVRSSAAEEATGNPLLCPGYGQAVARAGCSNIAQMTTSIYLPPKNNVIVALDAYGASSSFRWQKRAPFTVSTVQHGRYCSSRSTHADSMSRQRLSC